jgi:hypothetical protein
LAWIAGWFWWVSNPDEAQAQHGHFGTAAEHLAGRAHGRAEARLGKLAANGNAGSRDTEFRRGGDNVGLNAADVRQRPATPAAALLRQARQAGELLGIVEGDDAPAAAQRPHVLAADHHGIGGKARRRRPAEEAACQPALRQVLVAVGRRVPYLDRAEMRQVRICVTEALQYRQFARLPQRQQRLQRGMQSMALAQRQHLAGGDGDARPQRVIVRVGVGHHGIEPVVAALELDQDQQPPVRRCPRRQRHGRQQAGHQANSPAARDAAKEIASLHVPSLT